MRLALIQLFCPWGEIEGNLRRHERLIRDAADRGADLALFPELSVHGMWKDPLVRLAAQPLRGPIVRRLCAAARRCGVAASFGFAEETPGKPRNCHVLVDRRGALAGAYRKNFVTLLEQNYYRRGEGRPVFRLGKARVAIAICYDSCREELVAGYARRGADLVLMPHAWDADPILKGGRVASWRSVDEMVEANAKRRILRYRTHDEMLESFSRRVGGFAAKYGFHGAFANQVGLPHPLIPMVGPCFAVDPTGRVIARTRNDREGVQVAELEMEI